MHERSGGSCGQREGGEDDGRRAGVRVDAERHRIPRKAGGVPDEETAEEHCGGAGGAAGGQQRGVGEEQEVTGVQRRKAEGERENSRNGLRKGGPKRH